MLKALVVFADDVGSLASTQMAAHNNSVTPNLDDLTHSSSGDTRHTCGIHTYTEKTLIPIKNRVNK